MFARTVVYLRDYALPVRRFHRLAWRRQDARRQMEELNSRRQQIQRQIAELYSHTDACKVCGGYCCKASYNHFTVVDYVIRMCSTNPLHHYGTGLGKVWPVYRILWRKIVGFFRGVDAYERAKLLDPRVEGRCPELTDSGCRLAPEDRSIRCAIWACPTLRRQLSDEDFTRMGKLVRELCSLSEQAIRVLGS